MDTYYVYILRSQKDAGQTYVGFTTDLAARVPRHNAGPSPHTRKYRPWDLVTYLGFDKRSRAIPFEKYPKSHSGKAFGSKRLY